MTRAKIRISIPERAWIGTVSVANPTVSFRVIALLTERDSGIVLLEIQEQNPITVIADIERCTDVTNFDLLWKRDGTSMVQVEIDEPVLLESVKSAGTPLETPFEIQNGTATWELTTSRSRLSSLTAQLETTGIEFDLESVRDEPTDSAISLLTDRQREVLLSAAAQGYYDTPREATLTAVSASLGISKATGSEMLHRAEGTIVQWFIEEHVLNPGRKHS